MLRVDLYKDSTGHSSPVSLILPASRWDVLEAKTRLGVDSLNECYYSFDAPADVPQAEAALRNMHQDGQFFSELGFFAHRLAEVSHDNRILLNGAIAIHKPEEMKDLINLTWHTDSIVIGDAGNDAALGRLLLENDIVSFPEEVIPYLDFTKLGQQHRAGKSCAFDHNLYFEDLEPEIAQVYDGRNPPAMQDDYIFSVSITHADDDMQDSLWAELKLPATEKEMSGALTMIDATGIDDALICHGHSRIKLLSGLVREQTDLAELNTLAAMIQHMNDDQYVKYLAVLEKERVFTSEGAHAVRPSAHEALVCAQQLDEYDFNPAITAADIGSYGLIRYIGPVQELVQVDATQQINNMEMGELSF